MPIFPTCSVIGHVDVGKTSFLDYFKNSKTNEVRGITQQMTAYQYDREHLKSTIINPETNKVIQESMPLDLKILFLCKKLTEVFKMPLSNILRKCNKNAFLMPC